MSKPRSYPDKLIIQPWDGPLEAAVFPPGSKSITNRAFVLAALSSGPQCVLANPLRSEDTEVMTDSLRRLGFAIEDADGSVIFRRPDRAAGTDRLFATESAELFIANSGTSMRFLTALVA